MDKVFNLPGTYDLQSHGTFNLDGIFESTSDYFLGELYYGADGTLHVLIRFAQEPVKPQDIFGYVGIYELVSNNKVNHQIRIATVSAQIDTIESRDVSHRDSDLVLSRTWPDGRKFEAVWRKRE